MKQIKDKQVYESHREILDPSHTAVLVVDMQNDGIDPEGYFGRLGADVGIVAGIVPALAEFLRAARAAGAKVVYLNQTTTCDGRLESPAWLRFKELTYRLVPPATGPQDDYMIRGTPGHQVVDELAPQEDDIVVEKSRASGFISTPLHGILRSNGIETVAVTGESSYGCVLNTVLDASCFDYYTVVVEDLIAGPNQDMHETALKLLRARQECLKAEEIQRIWQGG